MNQTHFFNINQFSLIPSPTDQYLFNELKLTQTKPFHNKNNYPIRQKIFVRKIKKRKIRSEFYSPFFLSLYSPPPLGGIKYIYRRDLYRERYREEIQKNVSWNTHGEYIFEVAG